MNPKCFALLGRQMPVLIAGFVLLVVFCLDFLSAVAVAQQPKLCVDVISPWRASFTEINQEAANQRREQGWQPVQTRSQDGPSARSAVPANQTPQLNIRTADATAATQVSPTAKASGARSATREKSTPVAGAAISRSMNSLPNEAGQVWREYDISSYTSKVTSVDNPQQALLDWVLRETGNEMWFNEPLGILHATKSRLIVYHTPEIQSAVKAIVDRFVRTRGQLQSFNVNLVTVGNPNWRAAAYPLLQTVDVKSPGVEAWLVSKEKSLFLT
jgi:hypothetical protein